MQHAVGMQSAEIVVAINRDKNAPIFDIATYGVVGDLYEVVPQLIKRLQEMQKMMLEKMIALVTGGSRGIGRAICLQTCLHGCHRRHQLCSPIRLRPRKRLRQIEQAGGKGFHGPF